MKRTVFNLSIALMALAFYNFTSVGIPLSRVTVAKISFESQTLDYGKIEQHSDGNRIFRFENTGDAPLIISNVKASCGCTVPSYSKTPILPGETGEIKITYDTKRLGAFTKSITVSSNAEQGTTILKITGQVIPTS